MEQARNAQNVITTGQMLMMEKQRLGHGHFSDWLKIELRLNERTARRYMQVAERIQAFYDTYPYFKKDVVSNIQVSALYRLCADSSPQSALAKAIKIAGQGICVTNQIAKGLISGQDTSTVVQCATEFDLESMVSVLLEKEGIPHRRQVRCSVGTADIVSERAIYEIKHPIDRGGLFKAIGQVLMYRACINPSADAVVAFLQPTTKKFDPYIEAASASVKVMLLEVV